MYIRHLLTRTTLALAAATLLCSCGEDVATIEKMPPSPPLTAVGTASGTGSLKTYVWSDDANVPPERKQVDLVPKFGYAYPAMKNGERTLWLVVLDQSPDIASIDAADDRADALRSWCAKAHANFSALQLDSKGKPMESQTCAGDGRIESARLSEDSTMSDRARSELTVNDGKRVEGTFSTGVGSTTVNDKESFAETTGEYHIVANVAPLTLRDRVATTGDEHASGVPGAKSAFLKYWKAAGSAKTFADIEPWFTPDRQAHNKAQMAEIAKIGWTPERMMKMFTSGHAGAASITGAKAIGAAAVVTAEATSEDGLLSCQAFLLQLDGSWKIGNEQCRMAPKGKK